MTSHTAAISQIRPVQLGRHYLEATEADKSDLYKYTAVAILLVFPSLAESNSNKTLSK
jgi:hypothetical protein